jgi:hypothetical protein
VRVSVCVHVCVYVCVSVCVCARTYGVCAVQECNVDIPGDLIMAYTFLRM